MFRPFLIVAAVLIGLPWQASMPVETAANEAVRVEIERLTATAYPGVVRTPVPAAATIRKIYQKRGFAPAWDTPQRVAQLLDVVRTSVEHGLNPADYGVAEPAGTQQSMRTAHQLSAKQRAAFDVALTDSFFRLVYHLSYGKLEPKTRAMRRHYARLLGGRDASAVIAEIIDADDVAESMSSIMPHDADYDRLQAKFKRLRQLAEAGGWPVMPGGPTIEPGTNDARLTILATRLTLSGDLADERMVTTTVYNSALEEGVKRFQRRHGLDDDGLVGPATLRALNVSVGQRVAQIRVNLERARWQLGSPHEDMIRINVPGFRMSLIRDGKLVSAKKVIVGDTDNQTPIFEAVLERIVLNPTWTVPHSIASEELLQDIKNDVAFLRRGKYQLFDRNGELVDPLAVDWRAIDVRTFPFTIIQQPGPANQLGQVKFLFPNDYSVCMHDTPARSLFTYRKRAFSHGCIRVDEPLDLAGLLLDEEGWTRAQVQAQVESGKTKVVSLAKPLPVVLLYRTVEVDEQGAIHFYADIYKRDAALLQALDSSSVREAN